MKTQAMNILGLEVPVILAPMGGAVGPELTAAVSNAGGLGLAPLWRFGVEELRASVRRIKGLTDKPFGVNLNLDFPSFEQLDVCLEEDVEVISLFWQPPANRVKTAFLGCQR